MELWLLGAGGVVLIAITLWIVWPAWSADDADSSRLQENTSMTHNMNTDLTPQGDRFEDQYTAATADLSAGAVAATLGSMTDDSASGAGSSVIAPEPTAVPAMGSEPALPAPPMYALPEPRRSFAQPRTLGLGAGALLTLGGAAGGAWLYSRWQHERNKPINRLRRGARDVAARVGDRLPVDDLPENAAPVSGAAAVLALTGLALARALRGGSDDRGEPARAMTSESAERMRRLPWQRWRDSGVELAQSRPLPSMPDVSLRARRRLPRPSIGMPATPEPKFMGLGFGGLALVGSVGYLVWRFVRGSSEQRDNFTYRAPQ